MGLSIWNYHQHSYKSIRIKTGTFYEPDIKTFFMNRNLLITTAITAGAVTLFYILKRKMRSARPITQNVTEPSRHLTNIFAKAKQSLPIDNGMPSVTMGTD